MSSDITQANYASLLAVAEQFRTQAAHIQRLRESAATHVITLERGGWIGDNATAFFREMHNDVLPAVERLHKGLENAAEVTRQIIAVLQMAEEEGCACLLDSNQPNQAGGAPNEGFFRAAFMQQQDNSDPYTDDWNQLPPWLRGRDTNPNPDDWGAMWQRASFERTLGSIARIARLLGAPIAAEALDYYLSGAGGSVFLSPNDLLADQGFSGRVNDILSQQNNPLVSQLLNDLRTGRVTLAELQNGVTMPSNWQDLARFTTDNTQNAFGTVTVGARGIPGTADSGEAQVQMRLDPARGVIVATVTQNVEMYDRYDWRGDPVAYNGTTDTVVMRSFTDPLTGNQIPPMELAADGTVVRVYPQNTDISRLPGYEYIEYPPDSPDHGAAAGHYYQSQGINDPRADQRTDAVFGTPDHPNPYPMGDDFYSGQYHALETNGQAAPYNVYSGWEHSQQIEIPYTVRPDGTIVVAGTPTVVSNTTHPLDLGGDPYVPYIEPHD
jgi:WXG100 family type VII secretion target